MRSLRVAAFAIAAVAAVAASQEASARVLQTIGAGGPLELRHPQAVALGTSGRIYVLDRGDLPNPDARVKVFSPEGVGLGQWQVSATDHASDIVVDASDRVYVGAQAQRKVLQYSPLGALERELVVPDDGAPLPGFSLAFDAAGRLLVATSRGLLAAFDGSGALVDERRVTFAQDGRDDHGVSDVAVLTSGAMLVNDVPGVAVLQADGTLRQLVSVGSRPHEIQRGARLVAGPANTFYVMLQTFNGPISRIQKFAADGTYLGSVGLDRQFGWSAVSVIPDGTLLAAAHAQLGDGFLQRLAPITTVDVTHPTVRIDSLRTPARGSSKRVVARMRYALSERSAVRVTLQRRADQGRRGERYTHVRTIYLPQAPAGGHALKLDRSMFSFWLRGRLRHKIRALVVAVDEAGLESSAARATFIRDP